MVINESCKGKAELIKIGRQSKQAPQIKPATNAKQSNQLPKGLGIVSIDRKVSQQKNNNNPSALALLS